MVSIAQPSAKDNLLDDALLVHEVLRSCINKGIFRDPFRVFLSLNPEWTRERWDHAKAQPYEDVLLAEARRANKKFNEIKPRPEYYKKRPKPAAKAGLITQAVSIGPTSLHSVLEDILLKLPTLTG